jgi:uncharacterized protein YgiM (DUF1202 family)
MRGKREGGWAPAVIVAGCMLLAAAAATAGDDPDYVYAARKTLDIYATPVDSGEVVSAVPLGTILVEMEEMPEGWVHVRTLDGKEGWVPRGELSDDVPTRVYVQQHQVAVRFCPTIECPEIDRVGFEAELMEVDEDANWIQVVLPNGVVGWVEEEAVADKPPARYVVMVPSANLRSCPGEECPLIATLPSGSVLTRMDKKDDWYNVSTAEGVSGWIYEELVVREDKAVQIPGLTGSAPAPPAPPQAPAPAGG